jgi:membrane associated rhomboid family serine protease
MIGAFVVLASIMILLWICLAVCPVAIALLIAFAAHIDPLSGRWRTAQPLAQRTARWRAPNASVIACSESPSSGS